MKKSVPGKCIFLVMAVILLSIAACEREVSPGVTSAWAVDEDDIGGSLVPWPLVNKPVYSGVQNIKDLDSASAVLLYKAGKEMYVYPVKEIYRYEIVNDIIDGIPLAITYCPLTKSGICWERTIKGKILNFTPSGYLYQSNLMPYDFETESIWSQMRMEGVFGSLKKISVSTHQLVETVWYNVERYYPTARVFDQGPENVSNARLSDVENSDIISSGEMVFGVIGSREVDVFGYASFEDKIRIYANFAGDDVIVAGSKIHGFITAFRSKYQMEAVQNKFPVIMRDESGSEWNIFGEALSGPRRGERLSTPPSYFASRWAFDKLFKDLEVIEN